MALDKKKSFFSRLTGKNKNKETEPEDGSASVTSDITETIADTAAQTEEPQNWYDRLKKGLARSSSSLTNGISSIFTQRKLDADMLQDLEDILIQADLGVDMASRVTDKLSSGRFDKKIAPEEVRQLLADEVAAVLSPVTEPLKINPDSKPHVILVVGVNGAGKTTTIGKLAQKYSQDNKKVMLAAGDTFRAAAIEQLKVWGERTNCPVIAKEIGSDASGLAYDAVQSAIAEKADILMMDTAGRLQNKDNLMAELEKIIRVIKKVDHTAPHTVLLVLDATTGQNALQQVEIFGKIAGVTGLVMTKLDGTARGGILVSIAEKYALPVHAIGVGEGIDDLQPFNAQEFASALSDI